MILPAFIPSWWSKIMDDRVVEHYKGDLSKINMHVDVKEKMLEKYIEQNNVA